jgi:hypothetical protein
MRYRVLVLLLVTVLLIVVAGVAAAHHDESNLDKVKRATAAFHDVDTAIAAGYAFRLPEIGGNTCIVQEGVGGMGVHMVNTSLLDSELKPTEPEVLVYDPRIRRNGTEKLRLVAVEYVVFQSAWTGKQPPELFGRTFDFVPAPNRYDLPAFYALHAWIWKRNPSGVFYAWNPRVRC